MTIRAALRQELADDATIAGIVGTRVRWARASQHDSLPYIILNQFGNDHEHHFGGGGGLANPAFQIDCWAATALDAETLETAVREKLDNFRGTMGSGDNTAAVRLCSLGTSRDLTDLEPGNDGGAHRIMMEVDIRHTETVPTP